MGRPSTSTPEAVDEIIQRVSEGEPLAAVCRDAHLPALSTFYEWVARDAELGRRFGRAREAGFDVIASDVLDIVDAGAADPQHARVRAEIRLKLLAKWDPRRYGEAVQLRHADHDGKSLRDVSETDAAARVAAIIEAARRRALESSEEGAQSVGESNPPLALPYIPTN